MLLYQAKPNALVFDAFLRDIDLKLRGELGRYHSHVKARPADAIYRDATADFTGQERQERLTRNLIRAPRDEPILLVLDNFETNLKPQPEPTTSAGQQVWGCQDPAWDRCLATLATELAGSPSRALESRQRVVEFKMVTRCSYRHEVAPNSVTAYLAQLRARHDAPEGSARRAVPLWINRLLQSAPPRFEPIALAGQGVDDNSRSLRSNGLDFSGDCPHEGAKLSGYGTNNDLVFLAFGKHFPVAATESYLSFPGDVTNFLG